MFGVVDDTTTTKLANCACVVHCIPLPVDKAVVVVLKFPVHRSYETLEKPLSYLIKKPCFINSVPVLPLQSIPYFTRYVESTSVKAKQRALTICKEISVKNLKHGTGFGNVSENRNGLELYHKHLNSPRKKPPFFTFRFKKKPRA